MITNKYFFPEFYVAKVPICDTCKIELIDSGLVIMTNPEKCRYVCNRCNQEYYFTRSELEGRWKFRTI